MAKYTNDDPDIKYLDKFDQINYNFDMLKHDVDMNQEPYIGSQSIKLLTNPGRVGEMFSSPLKFTIGLFTLVCFVLIVVLVIYFIVFIILMIKGGSENEMRLMIMKKMLLYFVISILVLVVLYWFLNKIVLETTATGFMNN